MKALLWSKIEEIRKQPEHIRMRYLLVCLSVSMFFIVGIWFLSLRESFGTVAQDIPAATQKGKELLPPDQTASLQDLLKQSAPLRIEDKQNAGAPFFDTQLEERKSGATAPSQGDAAAPETK